MLQQPYYTLIDLAAALWSTFVFAALLIPLGYVLGWFTNILSFRASTPPWRLLVALVLSATTGPALSFWLVWLGHWQTAWIVFGLLSFLGCLLLAGLWGHEPLSRWLMGFRGIGYAPVLIAAVWMLVSVFSLVDMQIGNRLYFNISSFDHSLRTEFTHSITRTGVPPVNPLFHLFESAALKYHYFWFILCSLVEHASFGFVNARHTMMGSVVWAGWTLAALVVLFLRYFYPSSDEGVRSRALIGVCLLAVTGLDILPNVYDFFRMHHLYPDMEWWDGQAAIGAWLSSLLWVPHQVVSLVACLFGFLLAWNTAQRRDRRATIVSGVLAGFAFATAAGTSVFVTLVFAAFLFAWSLYCVLTRRFQYVPALVIAGVVAAVVLMPHLLHLASKSGGGAFLQLHLRRFEPLDRWAYHHGLPRTILDLLRVIFLPLNYFLELGFFFAAGWWYVRRLRRNVAIPDQDRAAILLLIVSAGICTFFGSALVNNDLGIRGFMPAQFVLLLWGADWIYQWRATVPGISGNTSFGASLSRHRWASALLVIGVLGSVYAIAGFRFYAVAIDKDLSASEIFPYGDIGHRTFAFRRDYEKLRSMLPSNAVVQTNPKGVFNDFPFGLYALRQSAAMNETCGAEFGGNPAVCAAAYNRIEDLFTNQNHPTVQQVERICQEYSIDALVMRNTDGAWLDNNSWMWKLRPVLADPYVRVYRFAHGD